MARLALFLPMLLAAAPVPHAEAQRAAPRNAQIVSVMPAFWRFYARRYPGEAERLAAFRVQVMAPYPELYGNFLDLPDENGFRAYFARLEPLVPEMRALDTLYQREVARTAARLRTLLGPIDARVYLAPSLFASDGQVQWIGGRPVVMFGIDVRAYTEREILGGKGRRDVRAAVIHEFVHAYHFQRNPETRAAIERNPPPLYQTLWIEGLATCLSHRWSQGGTIERSLSSVRLAKEVPPIAPALAGALLRELDTAKWEMRRDLFWLNGKRSDLPPRAGYAMGMLIADQLVRKLGPVRALALSGAVLRDEVAGALRRISAPGHRVNWTRTCAA